MAFTFVGYITSWPGTPTSEDVEHARSTGIGPPAAMLQKMNELPSKLPPTCRLIGSWGTAGGRAEAVMVVEAESWDDLNFISAHYRGFINFTWHPTATGGVPRNWDTRE